jgi:hypothetical protein
VIPGTELTCTLDRCEFKMLILYKGHTYNRFEVKQTSMHIFFFLTIEFAFSSRNVACPKRSGLKDNSL